MWRWSDGTTELYHYGIKGMKWGVRRTKEQLAHDRYSIQARTIRRLKKPFYSANGVLVTSISAHALDRCEEKSRPVTVEGIFDALKKPLTMIVLRQNTMGRADQAKDLSVKWQPSMSTLKMVSSQPCGLQGMIHLENIQRRGDSDVDQRTDSISAKTWT